MGRYGGEHLATDTLDVAGAQMVPEQAGDIGCARRMAEGRRKLSPGEDRMSRQEAGGLVLARLHGQSIVLRQNGLLIAHSDAYLSTISSPKNRPSGRPIGREKCAEQAINYPFQRIFQNKPPYGKDRQRYVLNLTVLWFRLACISKKTVRNTVNLHNYR